MVGLVPKRSRKRRQRKYKPKFFPFSAGIPWKIERGKYIIPEIDAETWNKALDDRNIIITAFGGLIESFMSLSIAEALASFDSGHKIFWLGNQEYLPFVKAQNLCKISHINLTKDILKAYPVPLFFDQESNAYLNVLNNYLVRTSYWGQYPERVDKPVVQQIFQNSMIPWHDNYIPKMRSSGTEFYDELCRNGRLRSHARIVSIILDNNETDILGWGFQNIREFVQLATLKGLKVVIFSHNTSIFYGTKILALEYNHRNIMQIIKKSWLVLSSNIQWLLIAMMISKTKVMGLHIDGPFDLFKNAEYLQVQNEIFTDTQKIFPIHVMNLCEALL